MTRKGLHARSLESHGRLSALRWGAAGAVVLALHSSAAWYGLVRPPEAATPPVLRKRPC